MNNIYKLIEHIVDNWLNNLSEALSPNVKQQLIKKFKQEADDYDVEITDKQLSDYIDFFDSKLKNNPNITKKDLNQYSLQSLIKLVSSYKGSTTEEDEEIEITPDIVYNENGLIIYNGSNEENCLNFGKGEKWCITRGSFASYRYDSNRKNPTFYLVKDTNLPNSDRKSFFVVVVGSDNTYKVSDRSNNDVGGRGTEWDRWESWSFVEQNFPSVRGLQSVFKYIPISKSEKLSQEYKNKPMGVDEWLKMPFSFKEQYLVVRKGKGLFSNISDQNFVSKVLPKQPQISEMIAKNYGYIDINTLLQEFDSFSTQNQKSIIANASRFTKVNPSIIESDIYPWSAKKAVVKGNLVQIPSDERYTVTEDEKSIVKLKFSGDDIKMGIFTENESYPNVKVNERTSRVLANYPESELSKIPLKIIIKLISDNILPKSKLNKILEKAKTDPNSGIILKDTDEGQILLDSNAFKAYKLEDGKFKEIPFEDDSVQSILTNEEGNNNFQDAAVKLFTTNDINVPISTLLPILKSTPANKRIINREGNNNSYIIIPEENKISLWNSEEPLTSNAIKVQWLPNERINTFVVPDSNSWKAYFDYLRSQNIAYDTETLLTRASDSWRSGEKFLKANPPLTDDNLYKIVEYEGVIYLVNKTNSRESKKISPTGRVVKANIAPNLAAQMLGVEVPTPEPRTATGRRGRSAGTTTQPATTTQPTTQAAGGGVVELIAQAGLTTGFNALPTGVRTRLSNGSVTPVATDRGATRRNGALGARGRVTGVITAGQSKFYVIRLASGTIIGSVAMQPDAQHYIVTAQTAFRIPNANALVTQLQGRNLTEEMKAPIIHMHALTRPQELEEIKYLLQTLK